MPNTIQLDGDYKKEEALANAALSPGHLVELMSTGKIRKHSQEGGHSQLGVAVEDALQGQITTHAYEAAELVTYHIQMRGTRFQGIVKSGETIVKGQALYSAGDGTLISFSTLTSGNNANQVIAYAEEAVTAATDTLTDVRAA